MSDNASYIAKGLAVEIHGPAETSGAGLKLSKKKTDHDRTLTDVRSFRLFFKNNTGLVLFGDTFFSDWWLVSF